MKLKALFATDLPRVMEEFPKNRFVFLTLTVRNCPIAELRETLHLMNKAWDRLRLRKEFKIIKGWVRTTEITRGADGSAHPHFHVLLMVPPSYFTKYYVSQATWTKLWWETMRTTYQPIVDVRACKGDPMEAAIETLKYSVKPDDLAADPDWLSTYTTQVNHLRFLASGGAFKKTFVQMKDETVAVEDLEPAPNPNSPEFTFLYRQQIGRYEKIDWLST